MANIRCFLLKSVGKMNLGLEKNWTKIKISKIITLLLLIVFFASIVVLKNF